MKLNRFAGKKYDESGFTLIEIMVAVFLLTIGLLGLMSVTVMVINGNAFSKNMTTATTLAKDKLEELQNTSYANITSSTAAETKETIYQRSWTVTANSPGTNMKTIVVVVTWPWQGQTRDVTLRSIISNK